MMRTFTKSLFILAVMASLAVAQNKAINTSQVKITTMVRCEAQVQGTAYEWRIFGPTGKLAVFEQDNGRVVSFEPTVTGLYNIVSVVDGKDGKTYIADSTYQHGVVPDPSPTPVPPKPDVPDEPDEPDEPDVPADEFGFIKMARDEALKVAAADRNRVIKVTMPDGNEAETTVIAAIAANYYDIAQQFKDGTITDPQKAMHIAKDRNHDILNDKPGDWTEFFVTLGKQASDLHVAGTIRNVDDWADVHEEIYEGLKLAERK